MKENNLIPTLEVDCSMTCAANFSIWFKFN